jgi:hypothetical protein
MNRDERGIEALAKFWRAFATHLSKRDPEFVFLETINEPMVEDGYRWYGIQAKLIGAIRDGAPNHTIIAGGHRWSGLYEMLFLEPYADPNVIYNFHFYEPFAFTHQGATWAGPNLPFYKNVPYPSSPEAVRLVLVTVKTTGTPHASIENWVWRLHGRQSIASTSRAMSLAPFVKSRSPWIELRGCTICAWPWRKTASVGPCGIMRAGSRSSIKPTDKRNESRSC